MTTIRRFSLFDIFEYSPINTDSFTETFSDSFYGSYISWWPDLCYTATGSDGVISGYFIGKVEGDLQANEWHGHVSAVTID